MRGQRGMSYWGVVTFIVIAFLTVQFTLSVGGVYLDDYTIDKLIEARLKAAPVDENPETLKRELSEQFDLNGLRDIKIDDRLTVLSDNGIIVKKNYEVRKHFIANIDLVVHFEKNFDQKVIQAS